MAEPVYDAAVAALDYLDANGADKGTTDWVWALLVSGNPGLEALASRSLMLPHDAAAAVEAWKGLTAQDRATLGELVQVWGEKLVRQAAAWRTQNPGAAAELDKRCREAAQATWGGAEGSWACAWGRDGWERSPLVELPAIGGGGGSATTFTKVAAGVAAGFLVARLTRG